MGFLWNFHRMMVTKCCSAYCQDFAIPFFYQGVIALVLNLHFWASVRNSSSSVRNSSYSSYAIWTKLSQNDCVQVPQRILSVCVCVCVCVCVNPIKKKSPMAGDMAVSDRSCYYYNYNYSFCRWFRKKVTVILFQLLNDFFHAAI